MDCLWIIGHKEKYGELIIMEQRGKDFVFFGNDYIFSKEELKKKGYYFIKKVGVVDIVSWMGVK